MEVAEYMTANNLDFFVSVDSDFIGRKEGIEKRLEGRTRILTPEELLKEMTSIRFPNTESTYLKGENKSPFADQNSCP